MPTGSRGGRKWHKKSRTGCLPCKSRKIKCDEQHPSCINCIKRNQICEYKRTKRTELPNTPELHRNLELVHHFTIATSSTLAVDPQVRDLWRVIIPQIGFSIDYILDGILAISALHMARHDSQRRDTLLHHALHCHSSSLSKALPLVPAITPHNCSHLFIFGVLALVFNMARPRQPGDKFVAGGDLVPEWLYLLRGIVTIKETEETILSSPVALIFQSVSASAPDDTDAGSSGDTDEKQRALNVLLSKIYNQTSHDESKRLVLSTAVKALGRSYEALSSGAGSQRFRAFYAWLYRISDEFLELLGDNDQEALCVLAFYSVVVSHIEQYWWAEGWAVHILEQVYLSLDWEHRLWIRWPIDEIGWVPESAVK